MRHERLFEAFGSSRPGQVVAAVVVGGLVGLGASRKAAGVASPIAWGLGGAGVGLLAGLLLVLMEARARRVAAGRAKRRGWLSWVLVIPAGAVVLFALVILTAVLTNR